MGIRTTILALLVGLFIGPAGVAAFLWLFPPEHLSRSEYVRLGFQDLNTVAVYSLVGPIGCLGLLGALAVRHRLRLRRRRRRGLRLGCGYDLRGSVDRARCPECGLSN